MMKKAIITAVVVALGIAVLISVKRNVSQKEGAGEAAEPIPAVTEPIPEATEPLPEVSQAPTVVEKVESIAGSAEPEEARVKKVVGEIEIRNAIIDVADKVGPAVVTISTERTQKIGFPQQRFQFKRFGKSPFGEDDPFEKFFQDFFGGFPEREFKQHGLGSGVLIDGRGYIITNEHVIGGAEKITITLPDGRSFNGTVLGADTRSDMAVVKIDAEKLPVAKLGNSDAVQTGEWVVALGNPFGHILKSPKPTVTVGVVSALHRQIPTPDSAARGYLDMIQTDAAINPGNSGGPLCNLEGEIVGINVTIFTTTGGYQGVGFAIPINTAKHILDDLIKGKKIAYGWLGVQVQPIDQDMAEFFNLKTLEGVLVGKVIEGSPADKAGMKEGDVILHINGEKVSDVNDLLRKVAMTRIGQRVKVGIWRNNKQIPLDVIIGERPGRVEMAEEEAPPKEEKAKAWMGIKVASITEEIKRQLGLKHTKGVVIIDIDRSGPAYEAGLREGYVIREINKKQIDDIYQYNAVTAKETKGKIYIRTENRGYFVIK